MTYETPKAWIETRSPVTRRVIWFGLISFGVSFFIVSVQLLIWAGAGWGSANFLPRGLLVVIYCFATLVGLAVFYYAIGFSAMSEGRIKWGGSALLAVIAIMSTAMALAHSGPQLSTLFVSSPTEVTLRVHRGKMRTGYTRGCKLSTDFGPLYAFKGGWCGVYMSTGMEYTIQGQGNAIAVRLQRVLK